MISVSCHLYQMSSFWWRFLFFLNTYEVVDSLEGKKNLPSVIQHVLIHSVHEECIYWTQTVNST